MVLNLKEWLDLSKPEFATAREWREWNNDTKSSKPVQYWLQETFPDWVRGVRRTICRPFIKVGDWVRYRTTHRYHVVRTGLKPGYSDPVEVMLYTNFSMLEDFVEIETALKMAWCYGDEWTYVRRSWYKRFFNITQRWPEAGLESLKWETKISPEEGGFNQAESAKEIIALYHWWKNIRPAREDVHDASGWTKLCEEKRLANGTDDVWSMLDFEEENADYRERRRISLELSRKIEEKYWDEDQSMLVRLMMVRQSLWT